MEESKQPTPEPTRKQEPEAMEPSEPAQESVKEQKSNYCSQCGAKLESGTRFCPSCGTQAGFANPKDKMGKAGKVAAESVSNVVGKVKSLSKIQKLVAGVAAVLILLVVFVGSCAPSDEKYAVDIVKDYQSMLKNPESMMLRGDVFIVRSTSDEGEKTTYCYFEASAENGYGGTASSVPFYRNGEYELDVTDDIDGSNLDNADAVFTQFMWRMWQIEGFSENQEVTIIDGEKVADKLGVPFYG